MEIVHAGPVTTMGRWSRVGAFVALTKPRIIELLLITTVPSMVVAVDRWPGFDLVLHALVGGSLSAGGANALNNYYDRDVDEIMRRTGLRPLPQHRISPRSALIFGWVLGVLGFVWLWLFTNLTAALLATGALLFYVFVYTKVLKRITVENIVIGGAAGAAPVLVGWAAAAGGVGISAWMLFAIVFIWTPPHFWALALRFKDDYAAAGIPMLPVVKGVAVTTRRIALYTGLLVVASLMLVPLAGMGWIYLLTAIVIGAMFVIQAIRLIFDPERAMKVFAFSTAYLAILFGAMLVDRLVF